MHSTSLYGEYYTKVFYISLCLNGSVLHSNILFFVLKRAAKAMQNCPQAKQHYKDRDNFRNCKFFSFFSSPYRAIRKGKSLLYRYIFIIFAMLKYKRL